MKPCELHKAEKRGTCNRCKQCKLCVPPNNCTHPGNHVQDSDQTKTPKRKTEVVNQLVATPIQNDGYLTRKTVDGRSAKKNADSILNNLDYSDQPRMQEELDDKLIQIDKIHSICEI